MSLIIWNMKERTTIKYLFFFNCVDSTHGGKDDIVTFWKDGIRVSLAPMNKKEIILKLSMWRDSIS